MSKAEIIAQATAHRRAEEFDQAETLLKGLLAANPDDAEVNFQYAWLMDAQGKETAAVPYYERAIAGDGLNDEDLRGAMLGLGSTYRCIGAYQKSADLLRRAMSRFPEHGEFPTFLAMALYNLGEHHEAMGLLLRTLANTSTDEGIRGYQRAILFYHDKLDETWKD